MRGSPLLKKRTRRSVLLHCGLLSGGARGDRSRGVPSPLQLRREESSAWKALIAAHEEKIYADLIAEQHVVFEEESAARQVVVDEVDAEEEALRAQMQESHAAHFARQQEREAIEKALQDCVAEEDKARTAVDKSQATAFVFIEKERKRDEEGWLTWPPLR